jgi:hypothetical protein
MHNTEMPISPNGGVFWLSSARMIFKKKVIYDSDLVDARTSAELRHILYIQAVGAPPFVCALQPHCFLQQSGSFRGKAKLLCASARLWPAGTALRNRLPCWRRRRTCTHHTHSTRGSTDSTRWAATSSTSAWRRCRCVCLPRHRPRTRMHAAVFHQQRVTLMWPASCH